MAGALAAVDMEDLVGHGYAGADRPTQAPSWPT
jgi:hypothetical protein